jgi:hypothetical protein
MVGTLNEENAQLLAMIGELKALGASKVKLGAVRVEFAADARESASIDEGELVSLRAENQNLRDLIKAYQED